MTTNNTTTVATVVPSAEKEEKKAPKQFNGEQIAEITAHFRALHALCWDAGKGGNLNPSFDKLTFDDIGTVCVRAINALATVQQRAKNEAEQKVRQALNVVLETHIIALRKEKAEYDGLSASLKARMGAFDSSIKVSVNDLQGILETSNTAVQVKKLQDLGFKIDGRSIARKAVSHITIPVTL
jgi:hypothetical protein